MKKAGFITLFLLVGFGGFAQMDSLPASPYKRFPSVPPFKLLRTDSTNYYTKEDLSKKKTTMIMLFSPDCEHCKRETEDIIRNVKAFDKVQVVMSTTLPFGKMLSFYNHYDLKRFDNIWVGQDQSYMLPVFFDIHNLPFLAFYNKKKELISVFSGALPVEKVLEELKK